MINLSDCLDQLMKIIKNACRSWVREPKFYSETENISVYLWIKFQLCSSTPTCNIDGFCDLRARRSCVYRQVGYRVLCVHTGWLQGPSVYILVGYQFGVVLRSWFWQGVYQQLFKRFSPKPAFFYIYWSCRYFKNGKKSPFE